MDDEAKRLLKLEKIPGFQLLESEKQFLNDWKSQQKRVTTKRIYKRKAVESDIKPVEAAQEPDMIKDLFEAPKAVKNVVKAELKEMGQVEES